MQRLKNKTSLVTSFPYWSLFPPMDLHQTVSVYLLPNKFTKSLITQVYYNKNYLVAPCWDANHTSTSFYKDYYPNSSSPITNFTNSHRRDTSAFGMHVLIHPRVLHCWGLIGLNSKNAASHRASPSGTISTFCSWSVILQRVFFIITCSANEK